MKDTMDRLWDEYLVDECALEYEKIYYLKTASPEDLLVRLPSAIPVSSF